MTEILKEINGIFENAITTTRATERKTNNKRSDYTMNNTNTTTGGKEVTRYTTREFAEYLLTMGAGTVHSFTTYNGLMI